MDYTSIYLGANVDEAIGATYVPTLNSAPTANTTTYTRVIDGTNETIDFVVGQFCRVVKQGGGYDMWQLINLVTESNVTTAVWRSLDNVVGDIDAVLDAILGADTLHEQKKMDIVSASGTTLSAAVNTYYNFASEVNTLAVTLPSVTDSTHINNIVFMLTTGSTPAVTFTAPSGINVIAQDGFSIGASTTYEINAIFNGIAWVVAAMKLNTTDIQPSNP